MSDEHDRCAPEQHFVHSNILRRPLFALLAFELAKMLEVELLPSLPPPIEIDLIRKEEIHVDQEQDVEDHVVDDHIDVVLVLTNGRGPDLKRLVEAPSRTDIEE